MKPAYTVCIAPMMDWTDRHYRYFIRHITQHALLSTPMITADAILHGHQHRLLSFSPEEKPLSLQLGGHHPVKLAQAARIGAEMGYDEINLNVGCPSNRVQEGRFGACLMTNPELVAEGISAMKHAVRIPITIKHRIGVDHLDSYDHLAHFVHVIASANCDRFIVHARKAWLTGLSPKENRTIPPLRYEVVHRLKRDFPEQTIILNGGIQNLEEIRQHLEHVDGVMIGRAAYENPFFLSAVDRAIFGAPAGREKMRSEIMQKMATYIAQWEQQGIAAHQITRHMTGLYHGQPGARAWRRSFTIKAQSKLA